MGSRSIVKKYEIELDLKRSSSNRGFEVVDGDTGNQIVISLTDSGSPVSLTGQRVLAVFSNSNGTFMQDSGDANGGVTIIGNEVIIELFPESVAPGLVECELQIYTNLDSEVDRVPVYSNLVTSAKFNFSCRRSILNDDTLQTIREFPMLMKLIELVLEAEAQRADNESIRVSAEDRRVANEAQRVKAENARVIAENGRVTTENTRAAAEDARTAAESERVSAEKSRVLAEKQRISAENARVSAENARAAAELERAAAESTRVSAELSRESAELARRLAESMRSSIIRGIVQPDTSPLVGNNAVDATYLAGWYSYDGGLLLVDSEVSSEHVKPSGTIRQVHINASGAIRYRTGTFKTDTQIDWNSWVNMLQQKEDVVNKVTDISESSTHTQYPSAKCVYDLIGDVDTALGQIGSIIGGSGRV
ncbi:MAG: hypothetical protein J1E60_02200 [Christensenellaceae bacterium]|nr:hypothetical protein [Christensenellaceae bacterium]